MRKLLILAVAAATATVTLSGCNVIRGQQEVGDYVDDAALTARVKAALLDNESVEGTDIDVNVYEGKVQLSGFADDAAERAAAEQIARGVNGVRGVENNIQLKDRPQSGSSTSDATSPTPSTAEPR
jgi:osmotically-inducible protein OsmY